jgi:transcriptional regulator with PAS, ATPase and Fis domain
MSSNTKKRGRPPEAKSIQQAADEHVLAVYRKNGFNKTATARELGVSVRTVYNRLKRVGTGEHQ